ncbi:nuclear transport factor 2 family protein [Paeniroseomonas aquatica]|uniref:Nuclear transport factor 2 family protein n=1 Tax=Paeniroseomonas aquatica TaxID=373043 RepID=A0ABT8AAP7_9PROT|nr:nuclear transport factor 2 family protein [Paeniroseomonas aquatica]MDN3566399.1 nuclear transport factor 2 family protein [Paeniroseomonas aquatica]
MNLDRRHLLLGGTAALAASSLIAASPAMAQHGEEHAVAQAVEALTRAMLDPDRRALEPLCADALSYGHSAGRVETKAEFIANLLAKTAAFRSLKVSAQTIAVTGNEAIVRHVLDGETDSAGKIAPVHIGVLQVWQKQAGNWRLFARQAFRI